MMRRENIQHSQAANYFNLTTSESKICGIDLSDPIESWPEVRFLKPRRKSRWTIEDLHRSAEQEELGLQYFEMAEGILLDPQQNFIGDKEVNGIGLGIAVLEAADLALLQTEDEDVREAVFDALRTFLEEYPEEFAHHLQMTSSVFGYKGLYNVSMEDVRDFWVGVPCILDGDTVYQPPGIAERFDRNSLYNKRAAWLRYASELVLSGRKPVIIRDACCNGIGYDPKKKDVVNESLQGRVVDAEMLINCPVEECSFLGFYTSMIRARKGFKIYTDSKAGLEKKFGTLDGKSYDPFTGVWAD